MNLLFCDYLKVRSPDGQSTHIHELLSSLARIGYNIVPLNAGYVTDERKADTSMQLPLWTRIKTSVSQSRIPKPIIGEITILWSFLRETYIFVSAFIMIARQKGRFDVIYRRHLLFSSEYLLAKLFKIPSVKEVNGIVADETRITRRGDRVSLWVIDRIERFNMPRADKIIVVTAKLREVLQEYYGVPSDKIIVIQNGANTDLFKLMDDTKVRGKLGLNQSNNYVCFAGTLYPWQGIENLVKSAPLVLQKCPDTRFLIVGDGPLKEELIALTKQIGVSDKVIFTGMVLYQRVPLYINASDICIAPFIRERNERCGLSPLKVYEYMACGKPVVASRVGELEMLEYNEAGILVEPDNPRELATAIIKLLQDQGLRKQMGENGRRYVVESQSWEIVAKRVAEVCQGLIDSRRHEGKVGKNN